MKHICKASWVYIDTNFGCFYFSKQTAIQDYVFVIFAILQLLFVLFICKKVPETKNKTTEEISAIFRQMSYE